MNRQKVERRVGKFQFIHWEEIQFEDIKINDALRFPDCATNPNMIWIAMSEPEITNKPEEGSIQVLTEDAYYNRREKMWMEYCDFLADRTGMLTGFVNVHGTQTSEEDIKLGYELRAKLGFTEHPFLKEESNV